jgi:ribosomal protein S18 acetylase RimI-like enzyme
MAAALAERGYAALGLGVVVGNAPAIAFYEAQGGRRAGAYTDPGPLWRSHNLLYAWDDLAALASRG